MKGSENFKKVIEAYLNKIASNDPMLAVKMTAAGKSLDDCISYILGEVQASGRNGFTDEEIFGMAMHYYDEADIKVSKKQFSGRIAINQEVQLTDEEKAEARTRAKERLEQDILLEEKRKLKSKEKRDAKKAEKQAKEGDTGKKSKKAGNKPSKKVNVNTNELTLF